MRKDPLDSPLLLQIIDQAYEKKAWHGPNLKQSLRGVSAQEAGWRPAPSRHNILEIALHAAYWKYVVRRKLRRDPRGSFPLPGSDWFARLGSPSAKEWREARALLDQEHRRLREAVANLPQSEALRVPPAWIFGVAFHDVYHAGQIQLLKRLGRRARRG